MRRAMVLLAVLATELVGCGRSTTPTALSVSTAEPSPGRVEITAPARVKAGLVTLTFRNAGELSHDVILVRVDGNHGAQELVDAVSSEDAPPPDWAHLSGGVVSITAGQRRTATLNLRPGSYYLVDTGSDDNNNPFARAGGVRNLEVTGKASTSSLPEADATITAKEYSFGAPSDLKAGTSKVRLRNTGRQPHLLFAVPVRPGKNIDDVKAAFTTSDASGPPPIDFEKATGAQGIEGGTSEVTTMTLQKGNYAFICFLNDRGGGPPHFTLGMLQGVTVS
jgi:hypothetical protein